MSDLISKQETIHEIMGEHPDAHYPSWYADIVEKIQPMEAIPVAWIEEEIAGLKAKGNELGPYLLASVLSNELDKWKARLRNDNS